MWLRLACPDALLMSRLQLALRSLTARLPAVAVPLNAALRTATLTVTRRRCRRMQRKTLTLFCCMRMP
jgi:hypothetical protein